MLHHGELQKIFSLAERATTGRPYSEPGSLRKRLSPMQIFALSRAGG